MQFYHKGQNLVGLIIVLVMVGLIGGGFYYYISKRISEILLPTTVSKSTPTTSPTPMITSVESPTPTPVKTITPTPTPSLLPSAKFIDINVLVLKYFPLDFLDKSRLDFSITKIDMSLTAIRTKTDNLTDQLVKNLGWGSVYHGYKNLSSESYLRYKVIDDKEFLEPIPSSKEFLPFADHIEILNNLNICDFVEKKGVKEVWIWMYHTDKIAPIESNMAGLYGDISNSYRQADLPVCSKTYTVYDYNYGREIPEAMENHMHQIEAVLNYVDGRDSTPADKWNTLLFWGKFVGSNATHKIIEPGCGWSHYPPNATSDYDWINKNFVATDCEDWKPDGSGRKTVFNCDRWNCKSEDFFIWWMQNIPGLDNGLTYNGKYLRNWWEFIGDFDSAMSKGKSLTTSSVVSR